MRLDQSRGARWSDTRSVRRNIDDAQVQPLTKEEIHALIRAARKKRTQGILMVAVETGFRSAEICHLRWSDIDWNEGMLVVTSKPGIFTSKSYQERAVFISERLLLWLKEHRERVKGEGFLLPVQGHFASLRCVSVNLPTRRLTMAKHWVRERFNAEPNAWKDRLPAREYEDFRQELEAIARNTSLSDQEREAACTEVEGRYFKRALKDSGLKQFKINARLEFFVAAESEEKAREEAESLFNFSADLEMDVEES